MVVLGNMQNGHHRVHVFRSPECRQSDDELSHTIMGLTMQLAPVPCEICIHHLEGGDQPETDPFDEFDNLTSEFRTEIKAMQKQLSQLFQSPALLTDKLDRLRSLAADIARDYELVGDWRREGCAGCGLEKLKRPARQCGGGYCRTTGTSSDSAMVV